MFISKKKLDERINRELWDERNRMELRDRLERIEKNICNLEETVFNLRMKVDPEFKTRHTLNCTNREE